MCTIYLSFLFTPQLHGNVEEELETLRFEELALQRRHTLQGGGVALLNGGVAPLGGGVALLGGTLAVQEGASLEQIRKRRKSLGEFRVLCIAKFCVVKNFHFFRCHS